MGATARLLPWHDRYIASSEAGSLAEARGMIYYVKCHFRGYCPCFSHISVAPLGANETMKPNLFVGSESESLEIAYAIQESFERVTEVTVWTQGIFDLSKYTPDDVPLLRP